MARSTLAISLATFLGSSVSCSFVDDFDKFHAQQGSVLPGEDAGTSNDSATASDAAKPTSDAALQDAAPSLIDSSVADGSISDGAVGDASVPPPVCGGTVCDDGDACTRDSCSGGKCVFTAIDADGDGYSPGTCKTGSSAKGGDCNDTKKDVYPGANEVCDELDNNCDGKVDEGVTTIQCYPDPDRDAFPNLDGKPVGACTKCPDFTVAVTDPTDRTKQDCWDDPATSGEDVFPGNTNFYDHGYGPGGKSERRWDYNCNGKVDPQYVVLDGCVGLLGLVCDSSQGFVKAAPECGESGSFQKCHQNLLTCEGDTSTVKQQCN